MCIDGGIVRLVVDDEDWRADHAARASIELREPLLEVFQNLLVLLDYDEDGNLEAVQAKPERVEECPAEVLYS